MERNREKVRAANTVYYEQTQGRKGRRSKNHPLGPRSPEERAEWHRDKSNARCGRAKLARRVDELTLFATKEAHHLRKLRNSLTGIEWHVDHIIPLKGKNVCGLHSWTNLAVIPKVDNLRKGANHPLYEEWAP